MFTVESLDVIWYQNWSLACWPPEGTVTLWDSRSVTPSMPPSQAYWLPVFAVYPAKLPNRLKPPEEDEVQPPVLLSKPLLTTTLPTTGLAAFSEYAALVGGEVASACEVADLRA